MTEAISVPSSHRLSSGFVWEDHRGPFRRVTQEQAECFDRDGYFVLDNALSADQLRAVREAIDPIEERRAQRLREAGGEYFIASADAITFTTHLVTSDEVFADFVRLPVFTDLCHDLIGPDVRLYWDQAVYKKPEKDREFPWHQDNGYTFVLPEAYLTCWVPLVDATVDNGCPWVVPGMHRHGTFSHYPTPVGMQCVESPPNAVPVPAPAGSIVVFSSLTPHRTGPNLTDDIRKAYILQYAPEGAIAYVPQSIQTAADGFDETNDPTPLNTEPRQLPILIDGQPYVG